MHSTTKWLVQHCLHVTEYLNEKTHYVHPIHFGGFFFMQFKYMILNPILFSFSYKDYLPLYLSNGVA